MKNKILETELTKACENVARILRAYSGYHMTAAIRVNTDPGKADNYDLEVWPTVAPLETTINIAARIYYGENAEDGKPGIEKVETYYREVAQDDPQSEA